MAQLQPDKWQFRLSTGDADEGRQVGRFRLAIGEGHACISVEDSDGRPAGVLLGQVIDLAGRRMIETAWRAPVARGANVDVFARPVLWSLGGNFLWIFANDTVSRIYPDASAQLPCVWDPGNRQAASTAHALFDEQTYAARFDAPLHKALGIDGEGWFPAGLTAHKGVKRLLPCHYLDLESWEARRFWSIAEVDQAPDPAAAVRELGQLVTAQIAAIAASAKKPAMGLTAGRETRTLLACAKPFIDRIDTVTVVGEDRHLTDSIVARRIAAEFGISHRELPRVSASEEQRQRFIRRCGHCYGDSNAVYHPSGWPIADSHVMIGGTGGEVGRGFFWRSSDGPETPLTALQLVNRLGIPAAPELVSAVEAWMAGLPPMNTLQVLDEVYLELRMGPWHGVQFCGNPTLIRISPLLTYRGVELMWSLPEDWKRRSLFVDGIIGANWPELLRIPFYSLGWMRDRLIKLQKVARNPGVIMKKLRKLRGA